MQFFEFDFEVLDRPCSEAHVICIAVVIVGDDCEGRFEGLVCVFTSPAAEG